MCSLLFSIFCNGVFIIEYNNSDLVKLIDFIDLIIKNRNLSYKVFNITYGMNFRVLSWGSGWRINCNPYVNKSRKRNATVESSIYMCITYPQTSTPNVINSL